MATHRGASEAINSGYAITAINKYVIEFPINSLLKGLIEWAHARKLALAQGQGPEPLAQAQGPGPMPIFGHGPGPEPIH